MRRSTPSTLDHAAFMQALEAAQRALLEVAPLFPDDALPKGIADAIPDRNPLIGGKHLAPDDE